MNKKTKRVITKDFPKKVNRSNRIDKENRPKKEKVVPYAEKQEETGTEKRPEERKRTLQKNDEKVQTQNDLSTYQIQNMQNWKKILQRPLSDVALTREELQILFEKYKVDGHYRANSRLPPFTIFFNSPKTSEYNRMRHCFNSVQDAGFASAAEVTQYGTTDRNYGVAKHVNANPCPGFERFLKGRNVNIENAECVQQSNSPTKQDCMQVNFDLNREWFDSGFEAYNNPCRGQQFNRQYTEPIASNDVFEQLRWEPWMNEVDILGKSYSLETQTWPDLSTEDADCFNSYFNNSVKNYTTGQEFVDVIHSVFDQETCEQSKSSV